jgi:hypothetical protein
MNIILRAIKNSFGMNINHIFKKSKLIQKYPYQVKYQSLSKDESEAKGKVRGHESCLYFKF